MILLDTTVLSLAYRRRRRSSEEPRQVEILRELIIEDVPLSVPGIVLQDLLSGVRNDTQSRDLFDVIQGFPVLMAEREDHVIAARIANACRRQGVTTAAVDCLIAAMAVNRKARLFTIDNDFEAMVPHCSLHLFKT